MAVRPKGSGFMVDFMVAGVRHREFGFRTESEAGAWELRARAALMEGKPLPPVTEDQPKKPSKSSMTIGELVRQVGRTHYASHKSGWKSIQNMELYARFHGVDEPAADCLTGQAIDEFVQDRQEEERSAGTINKYLAVVSVMGDHAQRLGLVSTAPKVPWQRVGEGRLRYFTPEEEVAILKTFRDWGFDDLADFCMFLVDTGCRVGEALKLDWDCFCKSMRTVTFWETKAGNHRTIPLTSRLQALVKGLKSRKHNQSGPFVQLTRHGLRTAWDRLRTHYAWIDRAVYHTFRHTCASRLVQRGIELVHVKTWMGHKSLQTTLRYSHLSTKHLDSLAAVLEVHPA